MFNSKMEVPSSILELADSIGAELQENWTVTIPLYARNSKEKLSEQSGQWHLHDPLKYTNRSKPKVTQQQTTKPQWGTVAPTKVNISWGKLSVRTQEVQKPNTKVQKDLTQLLPVSKSKPLIEDTLLKLFQSNAKYPLGDNMG